MLNDDELFKLPNSEIKYGNSIELIVYDNYSKDNFLNGKVIGEFLCNETTRIAHCGYDNRRIELNIVDENLTIKKLDEGLLSRCQLSYSDIEKYANGGDVYGWHISDLVIYDEPKELSEFEKPCNHNCFVPCPHYRGKEYECEKPIITRPPQSWCYIEEAKE